MILKIFDTLTKKKQVFEPIDKNNVKVYVCGPTVYDLAHIGNARPIIIFDVLFRILKIIYGESHVSYARNITDIDDKIIKAAKEKNISTENLTKTTTIDFHKDISSLNILNPTFEPKATETISEMISMISELINKNFAYCEKEHVLFNTKNFKGYGKLSKRSQEDMIAGSRVEVAPYKKNDYDFVLWKPSKENEPFWDSPWGKGRPGWHIECSSMIKKYLGESIDIHAGGSDLIFPHHENEIAQSESCHNQVLSKYWMHNGYLNIKGEKMSKSIGNILTIRKLLEDYDGEVLRFAMLSSHYRQPINFSRELLESSKKQLNKIYSSLNLRSIDGESKIETIPESLLDDINTPLAISELHELTKKLNDKNISDKDWIYYNNKIKNYGQIMGILNSKPDIWLEKKQREISQKDKQEIEILIKKRNLARQSGNFELADEIRENLKNKGIYLEDMDNKTVWKLINGQ